MSRTESSERVTRVHIIWVTAYRCDKCGKEISRDDNDGMFAHELIVQMDVDECVDFLRRRDYCPECMNGIWLAINQLINADPEAERDQDYN